MPIYIYKAAEKGCDYCKDSFEILQSMSDKPLTRCPRCNGKVKKSPTMVSGGVPTLSDSNLRDKGFTKLVKRGDGTYEKTT